MTTKRVRRAEMIRHGRDHARDIDLAVAALKQPAHARRAKQGARPDLFHLRLAVTTAQKVIGVGHNACSRMQRGHVIGAGFAIHDLARCGTNHEVRAAGAPR